MLSSLMAVSPLTFSSDSPLDFINSLMYKESAIVKHFTLANNSFDADFAGILFIHLGGFLPSLT